MAQTLSPIQPPAAVPRPYLEVRQDGAAPQRKAVSPAPGTSVIGRSAACDVVLNHPSVSRKHAELDRLPGGGWRVRDLGSRNGTRVNELPVTEQVLRPGDVLQIGQFMLRLVDEDQPSGAAGGKPPATDDTPTYSITLFRHFEPPRISASQISTILAFGRELLDTADAAARLRRLVQLGVGEELGGWWSYALRVSKDPQALDPVNLCDPEASPAGQSRDPHVSRSVLRSVVMNNEAVVANNLAQLAHHQADVSIAADTAAYSAVACPLASHEREMDLLYVILPPRLGSVEWMTLLSLAVEQYRQAEAFWAARRAAETRAVIEKEMVMARDVQARTLPRGVSVPTLDWALRFDPALTVCGDYVDVIPREDGTALLAIADVAGKGMQAALTAASLHATFHTTARMGLPLSGMVTAVNRHFQEFLPDASFVTAIAVLLDPRTGEGQCVNCGHLPVVVVSKDGTVRDLDGGDNQPLGVLEDAVQSAGFHIDVGEWAVMYTDGLTEMVNPSGEMLGLKRLREQLSKLCGGEDCTAEEVAQRLTSWLDEWRGAAAPGDDRTFLVVRRVG
jgi:serine phosphatase RsbU (regulator of sigma subunit)